MVHTSVRVMQCSETKRKQGSCWKLKGKSTELLNLRSTLPFFLLYNVKAIYSASWSNAQDSYSGSSGPG